MSNCLITKLGASVGDASLPKLGVLPLKLKEGISASVLSSIYSSGSTCVLSLVSGEFTLADYNTSVEKALPYAITNSQAWTTATVGEGGAVIEIADKYALANLRALESLIDGNLDTSDISYLSSLSVLGDGNNLLLTGDISNLKGLNSLARFNCINQLLYGDIKALGTLPSLAVVSIYQTQITGDLVDIVIGQRASGRTSGSISLTWLSNRISFNGTPCNTTANTSLSWTDTTITWNEVTINA